MPFEDDDQPATKRDFRLLAGTTDRLAAGLVQTQADVREIKATMATRDDISRVFSKLDFICSKLIDHDRSFIVLEARLREHTHPA